MPFNSRTLDLRFKKRAPEFGFHCIQSTRPWAHASSYILSKEFVLHSTKFAFLKNSSRRRYGLEFNSILVVTGLECLATELTVTDSIENKGVVMQILESAHNKNIKDP